MSSAWNAKPGRVLTVGDCMLDRYWIGRVGRISPEAPVPVVQKHDQSERLGGAANVALNATTLGAKVGILGLVGHDDAGEAFSRMLGAAGIEDHLLRGDDTTTTVKLRIVSQGQQLLRVDTEQRASAAAAVRLAARFDEIVQGYDCVVFSDYAKGALAEVGQMVTSAKRLGKTVVVDPKGRDFGRYRGADIITPNHGELEHIVGAWVDEVDLSSKAFRLRRELRIAHLLLTRSERGMSLFTEVNGAEYRRDYPTETRDVYDVTGAGDTVVATLAVMLTAGMSVEQAVPVSNTAAGIVVGKFGTSAVTPDELAAALGQQKEN